MTELSENIKRMRKELKLTQEQLAEATGVTVSAVYKWETGRSAPDIGLILKLAELFGTSTDVLLGYRWKDSSREAYLRRMAALRESGDLEKAAEEAETALMRFPNSFDVVYSCARVYLELGRDGDRRGANLRAIELMEHACELISQNTDASVSEVSIRTDIAKAHLLLGRTQTALSILKKYNVCGVNDALIGMVLGDFIHDADGAEEYLGRAFSSFAEGIDNIMVGYANMFFQRRDYDGALDCIRWLRTVLRGIQPPEKPTWFDKYDCVLLEIMAECCCFKGEPETAGQYLREAAEKAVRYDSAGDGEIGGMEFFTRLGLEKQPDYDRFGRSALEALRRRIPKDDKEIPGLRTLWLRVTGEAADDVAV